MRLTFPHPILLSGCACLFCGQNVFQTRTSGPPRGLNHLKLTIFSRQISVSNLGLKVQFLLLTHNVPFSLNLKK